MFYNYHGIIKKKIRNYELSSYEIKDKYHNISPCLILHFKDGTTKPIREPYFHEYLELIEKYI